MTRYLTPQEKVLVLDEWKSLREQLPHDDGTGERGYPDPPIFELCDEINALPGVCTLQSCAGHYREDGSHITGQLWLMFDEGISRRFDERAFELSSLPCIDRVERIYSEWGQEVNSIIFLGDGHGRLKESGEEILGFLKKISRNPSL